MSSPRNFWIAVVLAFGIGWGAASWFSRSSSGGEEKARVVESVTWTCSMHPTIQQPNFGTCPICAMDLIPLEPSDGESGARLSMSESAKVLAEIATTKVVRGRPLVEVSLVGKIASDETRVSAITARTSGRLDRLYVDYEGVTVRSGDHLAEIYSPELLAAGEELIQAKRSHEVSSSSSKILRESAEASLRAAREKLRLLGLTSRQLERLESDGHASDHVTLYARSSGVILEKNAVEGDYVRTGDAIYRMVNLDQVWLILDVHEADLAWVRYGQRVEFSTPASSGETFEGTVSWISPVLDPISRTAAVRAVVANPEGRLKPGMLARATLFAEVDGEGAVAAAVLKGQWLCPMHPEIAKPGRGICDICEMDLVAARELGHTAAIEEGEGALLVPQSAVLVTGKRAIVYVEIPGEERPTYEGREVVLGPRAGNQYVILDGLNVGEHVVSRGNFKIDSALQIQAKPSLMNGPLDDSGEERGPLKVSPDLVAALDRVYHAYFEWSEALAADDFDRATSAASDCAARAAEIDLARERKATREALDVHLRDIEASAEKRAADLESMRRDFEKASLAVVELERRVGHSKGEAFLVHCPMAFDFQGASWLQNHDTVSNPYFGSQMLRCGTVEESFSANASAEGAP